MTELVILQFEKNIVSRDEAHKHLDQLYEEMQENGLAGLTLVTWDHLGYFASTVCISERFPLPARMIPDYVSKILEVDESIEGRRDGQG